MILQASPVSCNWSAGRLMVAQLKDCFRELPVPYESCQSDKLDAQSCVWVCSDFQEIIGMVPEYYINEPYHSINSPEVRLDFV